MMSGHDFQISCTVFNLTSPEFYHQGEKIGFMLHIPQGQHHWESTSLTKIKGACEYDGVPNRDDCFILEAPSDFASFLLHT